VVAVGHRVVHGGPEFAEPVAVDAEILARIEALAPFAPLHQPHNVAGLRAAMAAFPDALQVACFDTAFHRGHAFAHEAYALPRAYFDKGIRRYGFHGLSYQAIARALARMAPHLDRVVVAHLGNGASACALQGGRSVASSMGFTALDGLPMGTRPGQIDPGVVLYLMQQEGMDGAAISDLLYRRSGLLGLSGLSSDMRVLEGSPDPQAAQAIGYFTTRIRREIAALAADMGGIDGLVFTAGIGENSARVRAAVCDGLGWLGLALDPLANAAHAPVISAEASAIEVRVIPTDEEGVIAQAVCDLMGGTPSGPDG
jgi:acetate kinase